MKRLILIGGLPGAGKSTLAAALISKAVEDWPTLETAVFEADDYFTSVHGEYKFNSAKIGEAHAVCQTNVARAMRDLDCAGLVIVSNTFSQTWERTVYYLLAEAYGYSVERIDLFDAGLSDEQLAARCKHGVPVEKIAQMRARWEK